MGRFWQERSGGEFFWGFSPGGEIVAGGIRGKVAGGTETRKGSLPPAILPPLFTTFAKCGPAYCRGSKWFRMRFFNDWQGNSVS